MGRLGYQASLVCLSSVTCSGVEPFYHRCCEGRLDKLVRDSDFTRVLSEQWTLFFFGIVFRCLGEHVGCSLVQVTMSRGGPKSSCAASSGTIARFADTLAQFMS